MKFLFVIAAAQVALSATCGSISSGSRTRAHLCGEGFRLVESHLETVCDDDGCTDEVCCEVVVPEVVVGEDGQPEVAVGARGDDGSDSSDSSDETEGGEEETVDETVEEEEGPAPGSCGRTSGGPRGGAHVCRAPMVFDEDKTDTMCDGACDDATCCKSVKKYDCSTKEVFSQEKARYCCITEGVGCAGPTCAGGAGFLSEEGSVCCHHTCGKCGGTGCYASGGLGCCRTTILAMGRPCSLFSAPCSNIMPVSPPPPPPVPIYTEPFPVPSPTNWWEGLRLWTAPVVSPAPAAPVAVAIALPVRNNIYNSIYGTPGAIYTRPRTAPAFAFPFKRPVYTPAWRL